MLNLEGILVNEPDLETNPLTQKLEDVTEKNRVLILSFIIHSLEMEYLVDIKILNYQTFSHIFESAWYILPKH
jgi:hypothetical protein